jgi:hypothetical protein
MRTLSQLTTLATHNNGVCYAGWSFRHMTSRDKAGFPGKIHLHIEDDVTRYFLVANVKRFSMSYLLWRECIIKLKHNHDLLHLLLDGLPPEVCPHFLVNL